MAKKRKATVARRQDSPSAHVVGPKVHDNDGDGTIDLALKVDSTVVPGALCPVPSPLPPSSPHDVGPPQIASTMAVASGSNHLDAVLVEDCIVDFDDEILDEDQLDFNFTDEECEDSPAMLPAPNLSSPPPLIPAK